MFQSKHPVQSPPNAVPIAGRAVAMLAMLAGLTGGAAMVQAQCQDPNHGTCQHGAGLLSASAFGAGFGTGAGLVGASDLGWSVRAEPIASLLRHDQPQFCFDAGTVLTPELMARYNMQRGIADGFGERYQFLGGSWAWDTNEGAYVTWSLVPDGTPLGDGYNSSLFAMMDSKFGGFRDLWVGYIQSSFDAISQVCGARFQQVSDDGASWPDSYRDWDQTRGDIRISAAPIDGRSNVLAYAYNPENGDVRLDTAERWENFADSYRFFRNVFVHELCHSMGLDHSCPGNRTKLMEPLINANFDILQHDDILGLQALYGDAQEPDGSAGLATVFQSAQNTSLEFFSYGQVANTATASVVPGDQDWTKSTLVASMPVTFSARPVGRSYDTSPQNTDGSCGSGNVVNSLTQTGLRLEIRDSAGNVIAASQGAPGQWVTVSAQVPQGDYYSVVKPVSGSFGMPQMYTLTRTIGAPQPPVNDPWYEGVLLGQLPYGMTINGTTLGATTDGHAIIEPGGDIGTRDVYYNFTPWDGPGRMRVTVTGGNHVVSVHRLFDGVPRPQSQWMPINANGGAGGVVDVNVTNFDPCVIRVAVAPGGVPGPHTVSVRYIDGPTNDSCQTPVDITSGAYNGTTIFARPEPSPYPASCTTDTFTLPWGAWYRFTAPSEGTLSLGVCNAQNTILGVYDGCPDSGGQLIACNDNAPGCGNGGSALSIPVVGGQVYLVRVSHFRNLSGPFTLNVAFNRDGDECDTASPIAAGNTPFSNIGYTDDNSSCFSGSNRWYRYTATGYSTITATTCGGANFDTTLAVWNGCPSGGGSQLTCNDDFCGLRSSVSFQSVPGQQFLLSVGGFSGQSGTGTINISESPTPGEICSTPIVVTAGSLPFSTLGHYTDGPAEPNCNFCCSDVQIHGDLWYAYVATATGTLTVSTCGADYDSKLAAYTDCPTGDGTAVACSDDACGLQSRMSFSVVEGENYLIRVGGYGGSTGSGTLTISLALPCPADFNNDGFVDFFDFDDFVIVFETGGATADFNNDGFIDFFDFDDFTLAFETGC
jgi:hypothetical protein